MDSESKSLSEKGQEKGIAVTLLILLLILALSSSISMFSDALFLKIVSGILSLGIIFVSGSLLFQVIRSPAKALDLISHRLRPLINLKIWRFFDSVQQNKQDNSERVQTNMDLLVGGIAHELSNPVMSMVIMAEYLLEKSNLNPKEKKIVASLLKEGNYCSEVIKSMVRHSRLKQESDLIPKNINQLLVKIHDKYKEALESDGFEVRLELLENKQDFPVDEPSLNYIFNTLINHAKISMAQSLKKELTFGVDLSSGVPRLWLKDSGDGISHKELEHLFSPEYMALDAQNHSGVNLSLCQAYAGSFGGSIEVQTVKGHGSVFFVKLSDQIS